MDNGISDRNSPTGCISYSSYAGWITSYKISITLRRESNIVNLDVTASYELIIVYISADARTTVTSSCSGQFILLAATFYGDSAILCHIDACAAVGSHAAAALHDDGGRAAGDVDGIAVAYADVGVGEADGGAAARHLDAVRARAGEEVDAVAANRAAVPPHDERSISCVPSLCR